MRFYLGTHRPSWLELDLEAPLFVSHRALTHSLPDGRRRRLPRAAGPWALDSGAFTELATFGEFRTSPLEYVRAVRRYRDEVGRLEWAAPQDHMTEPYVLARSRLADTVDAAQRWTVANWLELRTLDAELDIVPVLQGQTLDDYRRHVDQYADAGVDLAAVPLVGLGSVCRRQASDDVVRIVHALTVDGFRLHGFGVKVDGLRRLADDLESADSMAWSYNGRRVRPCTERPERRGHCGNCLHHALDWHRRLVAGVDAQPERLWP